MSRVCVAMETALEVLTKAASVRSVWGQTPYEPVAPIRMPARAPLTPSRVGRWCQGWPTT